MKKLQTLLISVTLASVVAAQEIPQKALDQARAELQRAVQDGEVAGAAHLVVRDGKVLHSEVAGLSDSEDKTPLKLDSLLRIYSMSKPIITVAAMTLYEQGRFNLDDPVARFIPAFSNARVIQKDGDTIQRVAPKRQVSIRDVLRHTTGYSYGEEAAVKAFYEHEGLRYWGPASMFPPRMAIEKAAEALARIPALHHPGERFTYGFSTDLLGRLIEVWSGQPLDVFLRRAVLDPLEMVDTGFSVPKEKRPRFTSCHTLRDGKFMVVDKSSASPFNEGFEFLSGGGGLVSTVRDYANFCQMLVDGGQFKGRRLLKEDSIKLMFTDQLNGAAGGFRFGLGFAISDVTLGSGESQRKATQYSWGGYASTDFRLVPEERLFQMCMQQRVPTSSGLANKLFAAVYSRATTVAERPWKATGAKLNWQPLAPMLEERFEHGCALVGDTFCVFGGFGKGVKTSKQVMAFAARSADRARRQDHGWPPGGRGGRAQGIRSTPDCLGPRPEAEMNDVRKTRRPAFNY